MFFGYDKRFKAAMNIAKDKRGVDISDEEQRFDEEWDPKADWLKEQALNDEFERGDYLAMVLAAFKVFSPIFIVLIAILIYVMSGMF